MPTGRGAAPCRSSTTASTGAEVGDESTPATHIFAARGTASGANLPPFSACAGGTSLAAGLSTPRLSGGQRAEDVMEENPGNLIRSLRQKLGMTQEEFAHEIAVTVSTVNRWENAHAEPSKLAWKAIQDLARKRGVTDDVLRGSGMMVGN